MKYTSALLLCLASLATQAKDKEVIVTSKGDRITMDLKERPVHIVNTNKNGTMTIGGEMPLKLNGQDIYKPKDHKTEEFTAAEQKVWIDDYLRLKTAIDAVLEAEKAQLPAGYYDYNVKYMVVDKKGNIAYYTDQQGLTRHVLNDDSKLIPAALPETIANEVAGKIKKVLADYRYTPFVYQGAATAYLNQYNYSFQIKDEGHPISSYRKQ